MGTCIIITTIVTIIMVRSLRGNEMAAVGCRAAQDGAWAAVDVVVVRGLYGAHESNIIRDFFIFYRFLMSVSPNACTQPSRPPRTVQTVWW